MPLVALGLIVSSAIMHAGWNFLLKQAKQKLVFMWCGIIVGTLCFLVILPLSPPLPLRVWPYAVGSALAEAVYYIALTRAYDIDDFSRVYPLARGAAPALLIFWTWLFLNEYPRPAGLLGIILLVLGLIVIGGGTLWIRSVPAVKAALSVKGMIAALVVALCVSIYTAIDGAAVHIAASAPYTVLVLGLSGVLATPAIIIRYGLHGVTTEWRGNWRRIIVVGFFMILTYVIVLLAYSMTRVSYAGAVREVSIVFAALMGWRWLGEGFGVARTVGAILIFLGIVIIAVFG